ncbi:Alpha/Beta hydrolase protein [Russula brevipes]|nr:Alpha/Beta hydrolase protein [Russula brevipes]
MSLGRASFIVNDTNAYFNRTDVKAAIHAPLDVDWAICTDTNVFPNGDASLPPAFDVFPKVIEKNRRTVLVHGRADFLLIAEGMRITLQNMTWNGKQGFDNAPVPDSFVVDEMGAMGTVHTERGLTYVEVVLAGHMIPGDSPVVSGVLELRLTRKWS